MLNERQSLIAPSILAADFARLKEEIDLIQAEIDYLHLDVMDGLFVPNISFGMPVIAALKKYYDLPFDTHLMIENPGRYIADFKKAGADILTIQVETTQHPVRDLQQIRQQGMKAGVALNPGTSLAGLDYLLPHLDLILIMTVEPGFGGQKLIETSYEKIKATKTLLEDRGYTIPIEVDGGVDATNIAKLKAAGASVFVAGSAIFGQKDTAEAARHLGELAGRSNA